MYNDKYYTGIFEEIFSYDSLMKSWLEFRSGKKKKTDVADFVLSLSKNVFDLNFKYSGKAIRLGNKYEIYKFMSIFGKHIPRCMNYKRIK